MGTREEGNQAVVGQMFRHEGRTFYVTDRPAKQAECVVVRMLEKRLTLMEMPVDTVAQLVANDAPRYRQLLRKA